MLILNPTLGSRLECVDDCVVPATVSMRCRSMPHVKIILQELGIAAHL